ncbi:MAG: SpoIIE family protein phosphatase [Bacteriovoracaceae bacterium]
MNLKTFAAESHPGPFLQTNEDAYDFDLVNELFMVFDGFGGAGIGDVAVTSLKENIKNFFTKFAADPDATMPFFFSPKYLIEGNALINALVYSHNQLFKENLKKEFSARAGASGVVIAKSESVVTLVSVGSCASFLYRKGKMNRLFIEDSFLYLSNDQYESHLKSMPLSGFGLFPDLYYQVREARVYPGDKIITMTDGVYSRLSLEEVQDALLHPKRDSKGKIEDLFKLSNQKGNLDNQSCMILEF